MADHSTSKANIDHVEDTNSHEAALTGAVALAALFSTCVEAFGLVHPTPQKWDKIEQRQLARLGLQQARLLAWGSVVGITSPPASVTNRAVPKHPSNAYPDLAEPTWFTPRDPRLDEPTSRNMIEETLSALVDRSTATGQQSRDEMMARYGLRAPKRFTPYLARALDPNRLESFRERHDLLREVAESYAHLDTRVITPRANSLIHTNWEIVDVTKFAAFVSLTREKVDSLVAHLQVEEAVDRAVTMDIRSFGWHVIPDRSRVALDVSKLKLLREVCLPENDNYPQYLRAVEQALENISRENKENAMKDSVVRKQVLAEASGDSRPGSRPGSAKSAKGGALGHLHPPKSAAGHPQHPKRPGFLKLFRSFGHGKPRERASSLSSVDEYEATPRSKSDSGPSSSFSPPVAPSTGADADERTRMKSHAGIIGVDAERYDSHQDESTEPLQRTRSKSVGAWEDDEATGTTGLSSLTLGSPESSRVPSAALAEREKMSQRFRDSVLSGERETGEVIRHDQYHGIARTMTKDLHQADY